MNAKAANRNRIVFIQMRFFAFLFFVLFTSGKHEEVINHKEMKWLAV